jgi:hypothetical protein
MTSARATISAIAVLSLAACQSTDPGGGADCDGAKCDTPGGDAVDACDKECAEADNNMSCLLDCMYEQAVGHCEARRDDNIKGAQRGLTRDAIRWAAADVAGVNQNNGDDRGQEYTEYFAVVQPPPKTEGGEMVPPLMVGKNTGQDQNTGQTTTTVQGVELSEDQIFWLEDHPQAVVGQCVFTSWHADVPGPLCGRETGCDKLTAFPASDSHPYCDQNPDHCDNQPGWSLDDEHMVGRFTGGGWQQFSEPLFRMVIGFNSNGAASSLVADCGVVPEDVFAPEDLIEDDFVRGCMLTGPNVNGTPVKGSVTGFGTEWRRSDSAICAATMRLHECGCGVDTDGDGSPDITDPRELGTALVPGQPQNGEITLRGFPLGTWSGASELPSGCRYADVGDNSQTIVVCDLNAGDMLAGANDMKGVCRTKYGDNVVTHVPIPADAVVCEPDASKKFTDNCGDMPWVIGAETGEPAGE